MHMVVCEQEQPDGHECARQRRYAVRGRAHQRQRQQQHRAEEQRQVHLRQDQVAYERGHALQGVGAEQADARRQVVAVVAQPRDLLRLYAGILGENALHAFDRQLGFTGANILAPAFVEDPGAQPAPDVATAGYSGQIVEALEQPAARQRLQDAEVEGRAANASAGEG